MMKKVMLLTLIFSSLHLSGCGIKGKLESYEDVENSLYDK